MLSKRTCFELQKVIIPIWLTYALKYSTLFTNKIVNKWKSALLVNANEQESIFRRVDFNVSLSPIVWVNVLGMRL